jgi:hypothetical protein
MAQFAVLALGFSNCQRAITRLVSPRFLATVSTTNVSRRLSFVAVHFFKKSPRADGLVASLPAGSLDTRASFSGLALRSIPLWTHVHLPETHYSRFGVRSRWFFGHHPK